MYIKRLVEVKIEEHLFKGKVIILYGARQVGKTTLVKDLLGRLKIESGYFNCDDGDVRRLIEDGTTSTQLKQVIGSKKMVVIDEAQRIKEIGLKLKLLTDNFPEQQLLVTGSSSFELSDKVKEPLTGRNFSFWLYPLAVPELVSSFGSLEMSRLLSSLLVYGSYPAVVTAESLDQKREIVKLLASDYLFKDVLNFYGARGSDIVRRLLEALALQMGSEVSVVELSNLVGISRVTVESYLDVLEKMFVIFQLRPFSRNLRKEIGKSRKIYFYDLGIRNALINNFNPLNLRSDQGQMWECFVTAEMMKKQVSVLEKNNLYFWRTYDQQEVDLVEDKGGKLYATEIKWNGKGKQLPVGWRKAYPEAVNRVVDRENYLEFLQAA